MARNRKPAHPTSAHVLTQVCCHEYAVLRQAKASADLYEGVAGITAGSGLVEVN
jgi:hypothetical protein